MTDPADEIDAADDVEAADRSRSADAQPVNSPLRRLSDEGLARMHRELDGIGPADWPGFSDGLLFDDALAPVVDAEVIVTPQRFATRAELAETIAGLIARSRLDPQEATRLAGLWSWMAAFWCDAFRREDGRIGLKADQYWFTQTRTRGSHVTLSPYEAWLATEGMVGKGRLPLLYSHPSVIPKISTILAANRRLQRNPTVLDVAAALYLRPQRDGRLRMKRKAATQDEPGGFPRFNRLLDQLDRTYDLHDLSPQALWELLPAEFERFKDGPLEPATTET